MTVLGDLLEQIDLDEAESDGAPPEWGDGVFEMPFSVAKTLLRIAEAAFEMPEFLVPSGDGDACPLCHEWKFFLENSRFLHTRDCPWRRIQEGKEELSYEDESEEGWIE